ncbi:transposable element Tcb2 transposase [Trichonephila clavipes]|nr:transposable element Tcb2 transposase [Trichonephila clavipes]
MVWGAISWRGLGPLVTLHGKVKAAHYVNILGDQVHPFVQTSFSGECPLYQDDNAPIHTAKIVQEWFAEHEGKRSVEELMHRKTIAWSDETRFQLVRANSKDQVCFRLHNTMQPSLR